MGFSQADLLNVDQVTSRTPLVIPEFQRGYAWQLEQWTALWEDLTSVVHRNAAQHYTGSIMVTDAAVGEACELIDGQQRMVTIALLLAALGANAYPITFRGNPILQNSYDLHALGREEFVASVARERSYYARNLSAAKQHFQTLAAALPDDNPSFRGAAISVPTTYWRPSMIVSARNEVRDSTAGRSQNWWCLHGRTGFGASAAHPIASHGRGFTGPTPLSISIRRRRTRSGVKASASRAATRTRWRQASPARLATC
ncbi:hypothetical protein FHY09_000072 [Xanthomonas sp. 60]